MAGESDLIITILKSLPDGSASVGLVTLLFILLATERLVTGPAHRRELADKDKQIDILTEADKENRKTILKSKENDKSVVQMLEGIQDQYEALQRNKDESS